MFLSSEVIAHASSDRSETRVEVRRRLERAAAGHLRLTPTSLFELPGRSFVRWRATIEELSAMAALAPDGVHLDHLVDIVKPMAGGAWRDASGFDVHLAAPWVLSALAGCIDTHRDQLGSAARSLEQVAAELAEFVAHQQATTRWGDMRRVAFNHTIIAYAALGAGALALDHHPDAPVWLERALEATNGFLDGGLSAAGMTWEGLSYCGYAFKYVGVFLGGLRARGRAEELVPTRSPIEAKLRRVPLWYAHEMWPKGCWLQNYNDSFCQPDRAIWGLLLMFGRYEPGLCVTIWERLVGRRGLRTYGAHHRWSSLAEAMFFYPSSAAPTALDELDDVFFDPEVGFASARDSWTETATVFTFNSGPFLTHAGVHDQADNNAFTLIARGAPMLIDSGDGNDHNRQSVPSSSLAHNLVLIDGRGEHPAGGGLGVSGRITAFGATEIAVATVGDAKESYDHRGFNSVRHCVRTAVFMRRPFPYLLIHDDIDKDGCEHSYEFVAHVPGVDDATLSDATRRGTGAGAAPVNVCGLEGAALGTIAALWPAPVQVTVENFETHTEPFREHKLVRFATTAVNPHFVVLARPLGEPDPSTVHVDDTAHGLRVELHWSTTVDRIVFPCHSSTAPADEDALLPRVSRSASNFEPLVWTDPYPTRAVPRPWRRDG